MATMDIVEGDKKHLHFAGNAMEEIALSPEDLEFIKGFDIVYAERWAKIERYIAELKQPGQVWVYDFSKRLEETGDKTPVVIASTASPYKFTRSVMTSIDPAYDQKDDFIREFIKGAKAKGAGCVVAMLGEHGSLAWDGERFYEESAEAVPVVNTVGAGDSYIAAFTYGVSLGESIPQCMARGKARATQIIQQFNPYI